MSRSSVERRLAYSAGASIANTPSPSPPCGAPSTRAATSSNAALATYESASDAVISAFVSAGSACCTTARYAGELASDSRTFARIEMNIGSSASAQLIVRTWIRGRKRELTSVVLHPHVEARDDDRAREVLGDPLALVDLDHRGERFEHERERVLRRDGQEWPDVFRDPRCEGRCDRVVHVLAEAAVTPYVS